MSNLPRLFFASALAIGATACSSNNEVIASCSLGASICYDYPNNADSQLTIQACVGSGGVGGQYTFASCPSANLIATCSDVPGQTIVGTLIRYYWPTYTPVMAADACSLAGGALQ